MVMDDETIVKIAERIYTMNNAQRDYSILNSIKTRMKGTQTEIDNILSAIKSGIRSNALNNELSRLENEMIDLKASLEQEKAKAPDIRQEQLECMLYTFREECSSNEYTDSLLMHL